MLCTHMHIKHCSRCLFGDITGTISLTPGTIVYTPGTTFAGKVRRVLNLSLVVFVFKNVSGFFLEDTCMDSRLFAKRGERTPLDGRGISISIIDSLKVI